MVVEIHMLYFLKLSTKAPIAGGIPLPSRSGECLASNRLAFWTCLWHLLSAFRNTKFWSSKKSKEVSEMTHWSAVSHTVAYMWKPVKPRWQTVWYAAIRSGGGGLVRRFGQGRPASLRGRELRGGEQLWSSRPAGEAATGGTLHMPVVGGKQGWMFLLIFIHADHNHESPNTGENIRSLHIVLLWVICLLSLFPSISSPSILKFLYSFPLSGPPNLICVRHGWLPTAYTLYLSPFSLFPLATISLYPSPKAPLHVHFPASFLLTATLCPRPETVYKRGRLYHSYPNQATFGRERRSY